MHTRIAPVLPGATIGILGGGHIGRLTALAAKALGYAVHVLEADSSCTSQGVADRSVAGRLNDLRAVAELARDCQLVTTSVEHVPLPSLEAAALFAPVRPGIAAVAVSQERESERRWLQAQEIEVGPWRAADTLTDALDAVAELGGPCYVKPRMRREGDVGPRFVSDPLQVEAAWVALGGRQAVVERLLSVELEISVLVARSPAGEMQVYPPALSFREQTRLLCSAVPGPLPDAVARASQAVAAVAAQQLRIEGLLAVEMFLLANGQLVVNELVPGAHATYHATEGACTTTQFEQLVRAITGLPLASTSVSRPSASIALLGDLWLNQPGLRFDQALSAAGVRLHLYGAREPRAGRVMGHLIASGETPDDAICAALLAADRLLPDPTRRAIARRRVIIRRRQLLGTRKRQ